MTAKTLHDVRLVNENETEKCLLGSAGHFLWKQTALRTATALLGSVGKAALKMWCPQQPWSRVIPLALYPEVWGHLHKEVLLSRTDFKKRCK